MKQIYIGTSGWQYKDWNHDFYPKDLKRKDWFPYYASQFNSVEMNSTFYHLTAASTFAKWRDEVPANFRFCIKGSQYITHRIRLKDPAEHIDKLFKPAAELKDKLGVVLWQLPANFHCDHERLEAFAVALGKHKLGKNTPQAIELRHQSWFNEDTYKILRKHGMALVVNSSSRWPVEKVSTAGWSYFRFHGPKALYSSGYSDAQLADWAKTAKELTTKTEKFFAYFNNDNGNYAPWNAQALRDKLKN